MEKMRRVVAGSKSEGARERRQTAHTEVVERLDGVGIRTGGFTGSQSSVRSAMSDGARRQVAELEEREAREQARAERERAAQVAMFEEGALALAVVNALDEGEAFSPRMLRGELVGHTPAELKAIVSARQDHEDARFEAEELREFRKWKEARGEGGQADVSAPTSLQKEAGAQMESRAATERARRRDHLYTMGRAREQSVELIKAAESYKRRYGVGWS
jgi:hypothetical protein